MPFEPRHLVLIPTYNTGRRLAQTVREVLDVWPDVWVVVDGSTDGSDAAMEPLAAAHAGLRILRRDTNGGKGAAVASAVRTGLAEGFTHALVFDADGQHPTEHIVPFIECSLGSPDAMILGQPQFGPEAPWERIWGRKLSIALAHLETLGRTIADPLFGFRVYPLRALERAFAETRGARRYDFDPEIAVRLCWQGVEAINVPAPCRYLSKADGGVSHFHYVRDNGRMAALHVRLLLELLVRWPDVRRLRHRHAAPTARESVAPTT